ncbi:peptidylprolyl isomerase [Paenibacillus alkalitolerans]|uniref:peptidylprolyl isomerase n=1 Tax=Paenibacillus alkalitolerans TaxID=2799335 RepID=UPI0018F4D82B|nr:peptidylprolyl isomerase [Paenibacillus alkalitolerans]
MKIQLIRTCVLLIVIVAITAACGEKEVERRTGFSQPPEMAVDTAKTYVATIETSKGDFTVELFAKEAPITVNNFIFLAKQRYFEGIVFHRIVPDYIIQTGDPTGTGRGGPGYTFEDELDSPYQYEPGIVAMANSGPDTNGSQFFICTGEMSGNLNRLPNYTIFGRVKDGMDTVLAIGSTPVSGDTPLETVTIEKVTVKES